MAADPVWDRWVKEVREEVGASGGRGVTDVAAKAASIVNGLDVDVLVFLVGSCPTSYIRLWKAVYGEHVDERALLLLSLAQEL